jgi:hypothetical protein
VKKFRKALTKYVTVVPVNEFRTSRECSSCLEIRFYEGLLQAGLTLEEYMASEWALRGDGVPGEGEEVDEDVEMTEGDEDVEMLAGDDDEEMPGGDEVENADAINRFVLNQRIGSLVWCV